MEYEEGRPRHFFQVFPATTHFLASDTVGGVLVSVGIGDSATAWAEQKSSRKRAAIGGFMRTSRVGFDDEDLGEWWLIG